MSVRDVVSRYSALGERWPGLWEGLCWTVVAAPDGVGPVLARLSDDRDLIDDVTLTGLGDLADGLAAGSDADYDACAWVVPLGDHVGLLEFNGFACSLTPTLAALGTLGATAVGMYWSDAIGTIQLSYAAEGQVELTTTLDRELVELSQTPRLAASMTRVLNAAPDSSEETCGLAVVEDLTDVRLDDAVLDGSWPAVRFRARPQARPTTPSNGVGSSDVELAIALDSASESAVIAAQALLIDAAIACTGLIDEPAVTEVAGLLKSRATPGLPPDPLRALSEMPRGKPVWTDPAWRRWKAGQMLRDFCWPSSRDRSRPTAFDGWMPAKIAIGDDWPDVRQQALAMLRHRDT